MIFIHNPEYAYFNSEFSTQTPIPRKYNTIKEIYQAYGTGLVSYRQCKCTQPWKVGLVTNNTHKVSTSMKMEGNSSFVREVLAGKYPIW